MKMLRLFFAATLGLLASCGDKPPVANPTPEPTVGGEPTPLQKVLATPPEGPTVSITSAKTTGKPGETLTLTGRIMGHTTPFVEGRAAFIIADPAVLTACSDKPGDTCSTPWDCCCDSPEDIKKATATIQIVDADGRVLKENLQGVGGLVNLATVTVTGKVAAVSSGDALVINATALRVEP